MVDNKTLGMRLWMVRKARNGSDVAMLAEEMGIPLQTWLNYERGVTIPGTTLLTFICVTGANPSYLVHGEPYPMFWGDRDVNSN